MGSRLIDDSVQFACLQKLVWGTRFQILANLLLDRRLTVLLLTIFLVGGYCAACWQVLFPIGNQLVRFLQELEDDLSHQHAIRVICVIDLFCLAVLVPGMVNTIRSSCTRDPILALLHINLRKERPVVGIAFSDAMISCIWFHLLFCPVIWAPFLSYLTLFEAARRLSFCISISLVAISIAALWVAFAMILESCKRPLTWLWVAAISSYGGLVFAGREIRNSFSGKGEGTMAQTAIIYVLDALQTESAALVFASLGCATLVTYWTGTIMCEALRSGSGLE